MHSAMHAKNYIPVWMKSFGKNYKKLTFFSISLSDSPFCLINFSTVLLLLIMNDTLKNIDIQIESSCD